MLQANSVGKRFSKVNIEIIQGNVLANRKAQVVVRNLEGKIVQTITATIVSGFGADGKSYPTIYLESID